MKARINIRLILAVAATVIAATVTSPLQADDTEIFFSPPGTSEIVKPNIMFIIDNSGSMGSWVDSSGTTRMDVVQTVTKNLIDEMQDVNIGVMTFNVSRKCDDNGNCNEYTELGGHIMSEPVDVVDNASTLKGLIDQLYPVGRTPLAETLAETARYFRGEAPYYDDEPISSVISGTDGPYVSPVTYQCQKNYAVFLTDGEPTADDTDSAIGEYIGKECGGTEDPNKSCLDDVAAFLANGDLSDSLDGNQYVMTHTVGFATDQTLLSDTASVGDGNYYLANDQAALEEAFDRIYQAVKAQGTTYVSPGVAINTFDRLNHLNTLYYALFRSDKGAIWDGNLKRYKLTVETDNSGNTTAVIVDSNGNPAIDNTTGFFKETAQSWWSPVVDGPDVSLGGAASQLPAVTADRNVYSNLVSNKSDLTATGNQIVTGNTNLLKADFGDGNMTAAEFEKVINWTRGVDVNDQDGDSDTTDARKLLADPLHSVPQLVIYDATATPQDTTIYYSDNQGFIHAVDGNTGESYFSFIPRELLKNQPAMMNSTDASSKIYGMDGSVAKWVHDENYDGAINAADNDFARIFSGMRRGGRSYYALDVTSPSSPELMWSVTGGQNATTGFEELAQTWSTPVKTKVQIGNAVKEILVFGGGYDADQDNATTRTVDDEGRALYIVDAESGALLWWAGPANSGADLELPEMQYSMPASPKVLDVNGDGLVDQIYIGDMGGQIFRFDVGDSTKGSSLVVTGAPIADLADSTEAGNRRFYHTPDLFGIKIGGQRYFGLVIGSGYQAHPLNKTIEDRIYMLKIESVSSAPIDPSDPNEERILYPDPITEDDLYDTTDNTIQEGSTQTARSDAATALAGSKGWYIRLENAGEKVLSESTTINNEIYLTTYEPKASDNPCLPPTGTSRLYHLSAFDGTAVQNYDGVGGDDALTQSDRYLELTTAGLPPTPQRMRVDDTDVLCIGTECRTIETLSGSGVVETYWYED